MNEAAIQMQLDEVADRYHLTDRPEVARVRIVGLSEYASVTATCLTDLGFPSTVTPDGTGYSTETPAGQASALGVAEYKCRAEYPIDPAQMAPLTADQKAATADYLLSTLVKCLDGQGYAIKDAPSQSTFLAGFDQTPPWNPYLQVYPQVSSAEAERLEAVCPPNTPPELLYGK